MQKISTTQNLYPNEDASLRFICHQSDCICNNSNFQHSLMLRGSSCVKVAKCCEISQFLSHRNCRHLLFDFFNFKNFNVQSVTMQRRTKLALHVNLQTVVEIRRLNGFHELSAILLKISVFKADRFKRPCLHYRNNFC